MGTVKSTGRTGGRPGARRAGACAALAGRGRAGLPLGVPWVRGLAVAAARSSPVQAAQAAQHGYGWGYSTGRPEPARGSGRFFPVAHTGGTTEGAASVRALAGFGHETGAASRRGSIITITLSQNG